MRDTLFYAFVALGLVLYLIWSHIYLYRRGRADGCAEAKYDYELGRKHGRLDADNWWINAEQEVDQARVKIWREGK
jgi:hypothetical protein